MDLHLPVCVSLTLYGEIKFFSGSCSSTSSSLVCGCLNTSPKTTLDSSVMKSSFFFFALRYIAALLYIYIAVKLEEVVYICQLSESSC